ncbi:MAG: hypothetical protein HY280_07410 [Nitrospinae bacterium]|nr:hypothetical protein [Nitrospinota bacterium]
MIRRKDGSQANRTAERIPEVECPSCACPNKPGSAKCMYCGASLPSRAFFSLPDLTRLKRYFGQKSSSPVNGNRLLKALAGVGTSSVLMVVGAFFLVEAHKKGGYFNWAMAVLPFFYAGNILRRAYAVIFDKNPN